MIQFIRYMTMALALSVGWLSVVDTAVQAQTAPSIVKQVGMPASIEASIFKVIGAEAKTVKVTSSGPNLTLRFAWGFPEGLACASLGYAQANEYPVEPRRPQRA